MTYSDYDIKKALEKKDIVITPKPNLKEQLGSCSIDLHLGNVFRVFDHSQIPYIDTCNKAQLKEITKEVIIEAGGHFVMQPGDFALAITQETVKISPKLMGRLEGRSSLARLGLIVHSTAGIFDPGWDGKPVLELGNLGKLPIMLQPYMRICAMAFEELKTPSTKPYANKENAKYTNQREILESRIQLE